MNRTRPIEEKDLRKLFLDNTKRAGDLIYSLEIPEIPPEKSIFDFLESLPEDEQKEFKHKIMKQAISELAQKNQKAIVDEKLRNDIRIKTSKRLEPQCKICTSIFYSVYLEWLTVDRKSPKECSQLSFLFNEDISPHSFRNHLKNHLFDSNFIRRAIVLSNPDINPKKVAQGYLQLLMEDSISDDELNPKKGKLIKDFLKLLDDMERTEIKRAPKSPIIDASTSTLNLTQINYPGSIPESNDTRERLGKKLTDDENERLELLQAKWGDKGSSKIREKIPPEVPKVMKEDNELIDVIFEEDD